METFLEIRKLADKDISTVTDWAREEGFAPGIGDISIYKHTDRQGLWIGVLNGELVGCISAVRYNSNYAFIGLFIVKKKYRGNGYGMQLWKKALSHLENVPCIGLEAALSLEHDYIKWGFKSSSITTRWIINNSSDSNIEDRSNKQNNNFRLVTADLIPDKIVQKYDESKEATPRPHFLSDWLHHPAGKVLILLNHNDHCVGFGRIRPCLLQSGTGWRIGPLIADDKLLAEILIEALITRHPGKILIDSPGLNSSAEKLFKKIGFNRDSTTIRMYKGTQPSIKLNDVYGLASLELG